MTDLVVFAGLVATICLAIVGASVIAGDLVVRAERRWDRWCRLREWRRQQAHYQTSSHVRRVED